MKKAIPLLFFLCAFLRAETVISTLTPTFPTLDTYAVTDTHFQRGGFQTWITNVSQLTNTSALNGITIPRRQAGMQVPVGETIWKLRTDLVTWDNVTPVRADGGFGTNLYLQGVTFISELQSELVTLSYDGLTNPDTSAAPIGFVKKMAPLVLGNITNLLETASTTTGRSGWVLTNYLAPDYTSQWLWCPDLTTADNGTNIRRPYDKPTDADPGRWQAIPIEGVVNYDGFATNLTLINPSITNLAALTLTEAGQYAFGSANLDSLFTVGDSFTYGAGATAYTNTYAYIFADTLDLSLTNVANGSSMIPDANWQIFPGWFVTNTTSLPYPIYYAPAAITEESNTSVLIGFNDVRTTGSSSAAYRLGLDHLLHYLAIPDSYKRFAQAPDASTGTWTTNNWLGNGNIGAFSSSGTLTFSNIIGTEVYIGYMGWATNGYGTLSVTVDGVSAGSVNTANSAYGNREYINGSDPVIPPNMGPYGDGKIDFCPQLITVSGLGLTAHTVVITASANPATVLWVGGNGFKRTSRAGPNVFVGTIPRQYPWTAAGTDALQAAFNSQLVSAVAACRSAGLRVILAPTGEYYNPTTDQSGDLVHPNDAGHLVLAEAFQANAGMDLTTFGGLSISGSSAVSAGSFTSLAVSGISSQVGAATFGGNVTIGGRLLNLPTASSGGTSSRFGYGTAAASSINITHSDTTLNRLMNISGNSISVTENSTGLSTNLSLGLVNTTTQVPGAFTVAQNFGVVGNGTFTTNVTITGITTTGNRLLVLPTADSTGFSSRFGSGGVSASGVQIYHSDTDLDRVLNISGNLIYAIVNSTSANAALNLGISGTTTAIGGNATVAGSLFVLPTASGGGTTSGFGSTGDTNSAVVVTHSSNALDRRLTLGGNVISAAVNSTGAGANLAIGTAGFNVANQGNETVAGTSTVTGAGTYTTNLTVGGITTLNNRLLVLPTAGSGGTSSRFGFGLVGASSVVANHSDTTLDRALILLGNSVSSTVNSTGAAAGLSVGTVGTTTTVPGALAVTQNVAITGDTTTTGGLTLGTTGTKVTSLRHGRVTLTAGIGTVSINPISTGDRFYITTVSPNGTVGFCVVSNIVSNTSFQVVSSSATDTSNVDWMVISP